MLIFLISLPSYNHDEPSLEAIRVAVKTIRHSFDICYQYITVSYIPTFLMEQRRIADYYGLNAGTRGTNRPGFIGEWATNTRGIRAEFSNSQAAKLAMEMFAVPAGVGKLQKPVTFVLTVLYPTRPIMCVLF
jgi:hypothetical protein